MIEMLITNAWPFVLGLMMLSLGLGLTISDFTRIIEIPKAFIIGVFCQLLLLPCVVFLIVNALTLSPELSLGVMILAFCPGAVASNLITKLAYGSVALSVSLTGLVSIIAIFTLPILVSSSAAYFVNADSIQVNAAKIGISMFLITAAPVALGVLLRHYFPSRITKIEPLFLRVTTIIFISLIIISTLGAWPQSSSALITLGPLMIILNIFLLGLGFATAHILGLRGKERTAIAIETGYQNGALGITIGTLITTTATSGLADVSLPSAIYSLTIYLVSIPFILLARRTHRQSANPRLHH